MGGVLQDWMAGQLEGRRLSELTGWFGCDASGKCGQQNSDCGKRECRVGEVNHIVMSDGKEFDLTRTHRLNAQLPEPVLEPSTGPVWHVHAMLAAASVAVVVVGFAVKKAQDRRLSEVSSTDGIEIE